MAKRLEQRVILLAGPTASGKSGIALQWAERLGAVIVNADSMQVYRDLRVLTARPTAADELRVPHRLYGHVDGTDAYSVGRWLEDVRVLLLHHPADQPLIFVGGTGLYLDSLTAGLSAVPAIAEPVRDYWRTRGLSEPAEDLHRELARRDPETASALRPSDRQRVLRALEVIDATGRSLMSWQTEVGPPLVETAERYVLVPERGELRRRIAERFTGMMDAGAVDEVAALGERDLDSALPVMKAIGVKPLSSHLRGEMGRTQAAERAITDSRQYAKRQQTWLRNRFAEWTIVESNGLGLHPTN